MAAPGEDSGMATNRPSLRTNPYRGQDAFLRMPTDLPQPEIVELAARLEKFQRILAAPAAEVDALYDRIPDTRGGLVLGTDLGRELLEDYNSRNGRILYTGITNALGRLYGQDRLWREIHDPQGRTHLMFTAGGVAAGKTTFVGNVALDPYDLVFDGTLREEAWALDSISSALEHGWRISVNYLQRPLPLALTGIVRRAIATGRSFPLAEMVKAHGDAQRSILSLSDHFRGDDRVRFHYWLNDTPDGGPLREIELSQIQPGGNASHASAGAPAGFPDFGRADLVRGFRSAMDGEIHVEGECACGTLLRQFAGRDEEFRQMLKDGGR